jgi:ABC-2 type transport system permease protein
MKDRAASVVLVRALLRSAASQVRNSMARSMMRFVVLVQPIIFTTIASFMFRWWGAADFGEYVIVGSGLMTLWMTTLWSSATDISRERWMGTLELLLIAPVPFPVIMVGKILGNTLLGLATIGLSYVWSTVVLRVPVTVAHPAWVLLSLVLVLFAFIGFALLLALVFVLSREANIIANGLSFPVYLASGLYFPLTVLPAWFRCIGLALPMAWARESIRWAVVGEAAAGTLWTPSFWAAAVGLGLVGLGHFVLALVLYRLAFEPKVRRTGQLAVA